MTEKPIQHDDDVFAATLPSPASGNQLSDRFRRRYPHSHQVAVANHPGAWKELMRGFCEPRFNAGHRLRIMTNGCGSVGGYHNVSALFLAMVARNNETSFDILGKIPPSSTCCIDAAGHPVSAEKLLNLLGTDKFAGGELMKRLRDDLANQGVDWK